ncbi:hypothetical protein EJ110_NYTH40358 [Nymphaea thermarum]|nr:hypothetical protein EJ110_NYTH40358 [Nymphaea thermarum]
MQKATVIPTALDGRYYETIMKGRLVPPSTFCAHPVVLHQSDCLKIAYGILSPNMEIGAAAVTTLRRLNFRSYLDFFDEIAIRLMNQTNSIHLEVGPGYWRSHIRNMLAQPRNAETSNSLLFCCRNSVRILDGNPSCQVVALLLKSSGPDRSIARCPCSAAATATASIVATDSGCSCCWFLATTRHRCVLQGFIVVGGGFVVQGCPSVLVGDHGGFFFLYSQYRSDRCWVSRTENFPVQVTIIRLTKENYLQWSAAITMGIAGRDRIAYVNGRKVEPVATSAAWDTWYPEDNQVKT